MNTTIKKAELLEKITTNRDNHHSIFLQAVEGFQKQAIELLEDKIESLKKGSEIDLWIRLPEPEDRTQDYDRVISMLEMNEGELIELTEQEFANYVMDDWDWKRQWVATNTAYLAQAQ